MSAEARILTIIDNAVREATEPLHKAVGELRARLAAVENPVDPSGVGGAKRTSAGRTPRRTPANETAADAQPAEAPATTLADDPFTAPGKTAK